MSAGRLMVALLAGALVIAPPLLAAQVVTVVQSRRAFSVTEVRIARGDSIRFQNADTFLHQVGTSSPGFSFSLAEQEPGQSEEVRFPVAGQFLVGCEIHPRMSLTVIVD